MDSGAAQQVGGIDGDGMAGSVVLDDNASLTADHINQTSLVIGANATFVLAPSSAEGGPAAAGGLLLAGSLTPSNSPSGSGGDLLGTAGASAAPSIRVSLGDAGAATAVPEPSTIVLTMAALFGMVAARRVGCRK